MAYLDRVFENASELITIPNPVTFTGACIFSGTYSLTGSNVPASDDGAALGSTSLKWSDLFVANGAVINFNSGDVTITHSSNLLTIAGGSVTFNGGAKIADDQTLILGTTVTTAETNISLEFDETTTGVGVFSMGTAGVPMVLNTNPGATVIAHTVNINHSAGAGDCDDLIAAYTKVNVIGSGDSGTTVVGHASRAYVGLTGGANNSVASQAYGSQPCVRHQGTGAITAMSGVSAKLDVGADNFTASTVNAGHFHIDGAATVTGQFDGIMIEAYPAVTCMDSLLALAVDSGAVVNAAIRLSGAVATDFLNFAATGSCGITTSDPTIGSANAWIKCHVGNTIFWLVGFADS